MAIDRDDERGSRRNRYDRDERDFTERAGDELRSWFGDDDAMRRRRMDQMERERAEREHRMGGEGRYRSDVGLGGRDWERNRGSGFDPGRYGERDPYGDYGEMTRSGAGWAGGRGGGGRYGSGHGLGDERYESGYAGERWGASDWQEQAARSRSQGRFAGRGPADYRRAAERILEDANEALTWHGEVDASQIQVKVEGDEVILEGTVDSRRAKRLAEEAVENVRGVRDVHNRLRVQSSQGEQGMGQSQGEQGMGQNQGAQSSGQRQGGQGSGQKQGSPSKSKSG